uniref:Uncharacterized protein n=1 Tax=Octopus bimaculoides TaxID=37653 RepID=A0A0L8HCH3_OCTBM
MTGISRATLQRLVLVRVTSWREDRDMEKKSSQPETLDFVSSRGIRNCLLLTQISSCYFLDSIYLFIFYFADKCQRITEDYFAISY